MPLLLTKTAKTCTSAFISWQLALPFALYIPYLFHYTLDINNLTWTQVRYNNSHHFYCLNMKDKPKSSSKTNHKIKQYLLPCEIQVVRKTNRWIMQRRCRYSSACNTSFRMYAIAISGSPNLKCARTRSRQEPAHSQTNITSLGS